MPKRGQNRFSNWGGENKGENNLVQNISWGPTCAMQQKSLRNVKKAG